MIRSKLVKQLELFQWKIRQLRSEELMKLAFFLIACYSELLTKEGKFYWQLLISWWPACSLSVYYFVLTKCVIAYFFKDFYKAQMRSRAQLCHRLLDSPLLGLHQQGPSSPGWKQPHPHRCPSWGEASQKEMMFSSLMSHHLQNQNWVL